MLLLFLPAHSGHYFLADNLFRAASLTHGNAETQAAVASFLQSLQNPNQQQQSTDKPFTTLPDLLSPSTTLLTLSPNTSTLSATALDTYLATLLSHLPPTLILLATGSFPSPESNPPDPEEIEAIALSLSTEQKIEILSKVLRSPQFSQSLASLTMALRDGGLPTLAEAMGVRLEGGGTVRGGTVPLGGGEAVDAFVAGVKKGVEEEPEEGEGMDTGM